MTEGVGDELAGIEFRYATEADLPECGRIHQEGIDGYLVPMNFPPLPRENQSLLRLHAHTRHGWWVRAARFRFGREGAGVLGR